VNVIAPSSAPVTGPALDNRRVLAALIDIGVVVLGTVLLTTVIGMAVGGITWGPQMSLVTVAWALYYYFALESGDGQTLGKKVMNLRVVRADGGATGMREIAVRTVLRVVDGIALYLVGLVVMMITGERRQRLGDLAAGTIVVDASSVPAEAAPAAAAPVTSDAPPSDGSFAVEKSPADIGSPLPGMAGPENPDTPQGTDFNPFGTEAQPAAEPDTERQPEPAGEEPTAGPAAVEEPTTEPAAAEPTYAPAPAEPLASPSPYSQAPADPLTEQPLAEDPAYAPASSEPIGGESSTEAPAIGPADEQPTYEPTPGEPAAEEPAASEPSVEPYPYSELPQDEPAAQQPAFSHGPVDEPGDGESAEEVSEGDVPVEQNPAAQEPEEQKPENEAPPASDPTADRNGDVAEDEPRVRVRSVETVSAMDMIMGDDDEDDSGPSQDRGPAA
jgi:uncharacterized RDD family membrane protein YckC